MNTTTVEQQVATMSRVLRGMVIGVAILVVGVSAVAFWMSFSVLRDLGVRSSIPSEVAWGLPLVIDGSIVTAILVILAWRMCGKRAVWPWIVLAVFSIVSIVGNGAHTMIAHDAGQGVPMWLAISLGAIPPIGLMTSCEMLVRLPKARDIESAALESNDVELTDAAVPEPELNQAFVVETVKQSAPEVAPIEVTSESVVPEVTEPTTTVPTGDSEAEPFDETVATVPDQDCTLDEPVEEAVASSESHSDNPVPGRDSAVAAGPGSVAAVSTVAPALTSKADRIDHIIHLAETGDEISIKDLAAQYGSTERTVQRYLKEAREKAPEAFSEPANTNDLVKAS